MELCLTSCASLDGKGVWGENGYTHMCMSAFLHHSPETITLLISYTAVKNAFGVKKKKKSNSST